MIDLVLTIATIVAPSRIHGLGCFAGVDVKKDEIVWSFDPQVDHVLHGKPGYWDRMHAYGSNIKKGILILPRDNAAWINFSNSPCLKEGAVIGGEPCLIAARSIRASEELTVPTSSDADANWKLMPRRMGAPLYGL
jgi:hypothetical protein